MSDPLIPIFDGHNDSLLAAHPSRGGRDLIAEGSLGHFDLPRAFKGGFVGGLFAIFVPNELRLERTATAAGWEAPYAPSLGFDYARRFTEEALSILDDTVARSGDRLRLIRTIGEYDEARKADAIALILHFEGAEAIDEDLHALESYYERGLRSLGIVWSRPNAFGYGVPFAYPATPDVGPGLTPEGIRLVNACNRMGIVIDLSHLNEKGFWDVAKRSSAPLVASHSAAHTLTSTARNLTDSQLDAIKESSGIVGVNFCVSDIRPDANNDTNTPITALIHHIAYMVERMGIDHVGLGSDFDGAAIPSEIGDVSGLQEIVSALRESGFSDTDIKKVAHDNWLRVLRSTWR